MLPNNACRVGSFLPLFLQHQDKVVVHTLMSSSPVLHFGLMLAVERLQEDPFSQQQVGAASHDMCVYVLPAPVVEAAVLRGLGLTPCMLAQNGPIDE